MATYVAFGLNGRSPKAVGLAIYILLLIGVLYAANVKKQTESTQSARVRSTIQFN